MTRTARLLASAVIAAAAVLAFGDPAAADPPRPTDYRSQITSVRPNADGVTIEIVGGDSFLRVAVDQGHEVSIEGYRGEPYLRVLADGTVEENLNSEATYINADRYGSVGKLPDRVDPDAEPEWRQVAEGGTYAWHDHRIHWMSPQRPPGIEPGGLVQAWEVPMVVDGVDVVVAGALTLEAGVAPIPWLLLGILTAAGGIVAVRRLGAGVAVGSAIVATALALVVGAGELQSIPPEAGRNPFVVAVPTVGLVAAVTAIVARHRAVNVPVLAAVAAVIGWAGLRIDVFTRPVLPTELPSTVDRAGTAVALGLAVAVAASTVVGPNRRRPAIANAERPRPAG